MEYILPHKLKTARKMRGLTLEALSLRMDGLVTKQALSKYEQGKMQPTGAVMSALSRALDLPMDYFYRQGIEVGAICFRMDSRLPAKSAEQMVNTARDKVEHYLDVEEMLALTSVVANPIRGHVVRTTADVEAAASKLRAKWQLGDMPIFSVYDKLESQGVKLVEFEAGIASILGFSCWVNDNIPLIVINLSANHTTERKRFTAIHELGHLFLRFPKDMEKSLRERYCNRFAGAVLCPASVMRQELGGSRQVLALEELVSLRNRYGISVAAAVHRAKDLGIISEVYYNDLFNHHIHANRMEEGWGCYPIEEHTDRFERLLHRCVAEGFLSVEKAAFLLKEKPKEYKRKLTLLL